jgi:hypothetical protein
LPRYESWSVAPQSSVSVLVLRKSPLDSRVRVPASGLPFWSTKPTADPWHCPRCAIVPLGLNATAPLASSTQAIATSPFEVLRW